MKIQISRMPYSHGRLWAWSIAESSFLRSIKMFLPWCFSRNEVVKGKVKCTLVQALRLCTVSTAHRGSRGIALLILDQDTRRGWGVSVTPRPLFTPGKDPVPIVQEAGWAPGPVSRMGWNHKEIHAVFPHITPCWLVICCRPFVQEFTASNFR